MTTPTSLVRATARGRRAEVLTSDQQAFGGPGPASPSGDAGAVALVLDDVRVAFGNTVALDGVSFRCRPGTVHTVLGENGSGKSTLVKLVSGVLAPERGAVSIGGQPLAPCTPWGAGKLGVATVFQEVLVAPTLSVEENALLGQDRWTRRAQSRTVRRARVAEVLSEISTHPFDVTGPVGDLELVHQHQVAIARALLTDPAVLVLDESTAALDVSERDLLFDAVRRRMAQGTAVIFVSHRLDEVLTLSDEVSVLSSGRKVATLGHGDITEDRLLHLLNPEHHTP